MVPGFTVREIAWAELRRQDQLKRAALHHMVSLSQPNRMERVRGSWIGNAMLYASALLLLVVLATV